MLHIIHIVLEAMDSEFAQHKQARQFCSSLELRKQKVRQIRIRSMWFLIGLPGAFSSQCISFSQQMSVTYQ